MNKLTTEEYWEQYWSTCVLPSAINLNHPYDRCVARSLAKNLVGSKPDLHLLEIGCAPGRWMDYLAKNFNFIPTGIEYSPMAAEMTRKNLQLLGHDNFSIIQNDFLQTTPHKQFDIVISLGFIEHFHNTSDVICKHLDWLSPDGTLVLGIPNLRGFFYHVQRLLDVEIITIHNLSIMNKTFFKQIAKENNLSIQYLEYIGSFEPDLFIFPSKPTFLSHYLILPLVWLLRQIRKLKFFDHINSRFFSSYILCVLKKQ